MNRLLEGIIEARGSKVKQLSVVLLLPVMVSVLGCGDPTAPSGPDLTHVIEGPKHFGGHTYYLLQNATWHDSDLIASEMGGYLVTVNSEAENEWLVNEFSPGRNRYLWTGFTDQDSEGVFVWTSGDPVTYTNWAPDQPDNLSGGQHYAYIVGSPPPFSGSILQWDDEFDTPSQNPGIIHGVVEIE